MKQKGLRINKDKRIEWLSKNGTEDALELLGLSVENFSRKAKEENMKYKTRKTILKNVARSKNRIAEIRKRVTKQDELMPEEPLSDAPGQTASKVDQVISAVVDNIVDPLITLATEVEDGTKQIDDVTGEITNIVDNAVSTVIDPLIEVSDEVQVLEETTAVETMASDEEWMEEEEKQEEELMPVEPAPEVEAAAVSAAEEIDSAVEVLVQDVVEPLVDAMEELDTAVKSLLKRFESVEKSQKAVVKRVNGITKSMQEYEEVETIPSASVTDRVRQRITKQLGKGKSGFSDPLDQADPLLERKPVENVVKNADYGNSMFNGFIEGN